MQPKPRPIQRFAQAVSKCSAEVGPFPPPTVAVLQRIKHKVQAAVYGKCVVADYNHVHKDKCAQEFLKLKDCYLVCN